MSIVEARIEKLRLDFQPRAQGWLEIVQGYLLPLRYSGYKVRVTETLRSGERQAELQAKGASKLKAGLHQTGRAFDFACFDEQGVYLRDDKTGVYMACGQVAEALGCEWGGRWTTFKDFSHIQWLDQHKTVHAALVEAGLIA
jgi:peptidoglycan LD-endopeptidase CwlK